jgi:hypothetical protein
MHQLPQSKHQGPFAGIIMLVIGVALALWLKRIYETHGTLHSLVVFAAPLLILMGAIDLAQPNLMKKIEQENRFPPVIIALIIVAMLVSFYLRGVVFANWE